MCVCEWQEFVYFLHNIFFLKSLRSTDLLYNKCEITAAKMFCEAEDR